MHQPMTNGLALPAYWSVHQRTLNSVSVTVSWVELSLVYSRSLMCTFCARLNKQKLIQINWFKTLRNPKTHPVWSSYKNLKIPNNPKKPKPKKVQNPPGWIFKEPFFFANPAAKQLSSLPTAIVERSAICRCEHCVYLHRTSDDWWRSTCPS